METAKSDAQSGAAETNERDYSFFYDLTTAPCFRESTMYAIGGGAAIGGLNFYRNRDPMRSAEIMIKTGCGIALLSWMACRRQFYAQREITYSTLEALKQKQAVDAAARARDMRKTEKPSSSES